VCSNLPLTSPGKSPFRSPGFRQFDTNAATNITPVSPMVTSSIEFYESTVEPIVKETKSGLFQAKEDIPFPMVGAFVRVDAVHLLCKITLVQEFYNSYTPPTKSGKKKTNEKEDEGVDAIYYIPVQPSSVIIIYSYLCYT
jgi:hypothetical protein